LLPTHCRSLRVKIDPSTMPVSEQRVIPDEVQNGYLAEHQKLAGSSPSALEARRGEATLTSGAELSLLRLHAGFHVLYVDRTEHHDAGRCSNETREGQGPERHRPGSLGGMEIANNRRADTGEQIAAALDEAAQRRRALLRQRMFTRVMPMFSNIGPSPARMSQGQGSCGAYPRSPRNPRWGAGTAPCAPPRSKEPRWPSWASAILATRSPAAPAASACASSPSPARPVPTRC
jgi:hypothetical protein